MLITRYNKQSSANKRTLDFTISGRSLINNRNSRDPKLFLGVLQSLQSKWQSESNLEVPVECGSVRSVLSTVVCCLVYHNVCLRSSLWRGTLSKAFEKSNNTASICFPSDRFFARSWIVVISWVSQDLRALKPC